MKKFVLFILLVFSVSLQAQSYQKLLAGTVTTFNVVGLGKFAKPAGQSSNLIPCSTPTVSSSAGVWQAVGDSIWHNKTYKKMYGQGVFAGIIREDTLAKKIYFSPACDTGETLLYDFSLAQGDTISYNLPFSTAGTIVSGVFTVDSIKLMHDYNIYYHRHFYLTNHNSGSGILEMIEGVGNANHPLFLYYWFTDGILKQWSQSLFSPEIAFSEVLACKVDDSTRVYYDSVAFFLANGGQKSFTINVYDSCYYSSFCCTAGLENHNAIDNLSFYPNPASGVLHCEIETRDNAELSFSLVNGLGQEIKKFPPQKLAKGKNEISFVVDDLESGIYFLTLYSGGFAAHKVISIQR